MSFGRRVTPDTIKVDLRTTPRTTVSREAKILSGWGRPVDATITDLSTAGARVRSGSALPAGGALVLVDMTAGVAYLADVVWRKAGEAGLKFSRSGNLRGLVPAEFSAARQLWLSRSERTTLI